MLGDGIRRNISTVTKEERDRLRDAIIKLQTDYHFPGVRTDTPVGGVSWWFKQDEIHAHSHVHGVPAFVPWHRELMKRFEAMIRTVDPELSLHYWDWTQDPRTLSDGQGGTINLFSTDFLGSASGLPGEPLQANTAPYRPDGFYVPGASPYRSDNEFDPSNNPFDPPQDLMRNVGGGPLVASDAPALAAPTYRQFHDLLSISHGTAHGYIGGTLGGPHTSFRDPFVYLLHSNLDRIFAMWQRDPAHPGRLDPAHLYDYGPTDWINPATGLSQPETGSGDVASGDPWWGFSSPLEPWASPGAQTAATGIIANVQATRPWAPPENQQVFKDCRDPSVVNPPSYDTARHACYIIANRDTFSTSEVLTKATPAIFANAFAVVCDGFMPRELGAASTPLPNPPPNLPAFTFTGASNIAAVNPTASYEDPSGSVDMPQRIVLAYDLQFTNANDFPTTSGGEAFANLQASLNYNVDTGTGGSVVPQTAVATTGLVLANQPNPYMVDTEQGDPSPYWLSVDTRVFQRRASDPPLAGVTQGDLDTDPNAPFTFIQGVIAAFNGLPNDINHPFLTQLSEDETASQLELSQKVGGQRVYNYSIAKVRYLAPVGVPATQASVFFRVFSTAVAALDYDSTSGPTGAYRRTGNANGATVPLLGIEDDSKGQPETSSIPFFATARVDTSAVSMTTQAVDAPNIQSIPGTGSENVAYFGAWLDINLAPGDHHFTKFPLTPAGITGWPDGPYAGPVQSLQQLMLGTHHCMVAELFFWPPGAGGDSIPHEASPASSDRLAQRNLVLVASGNPGYPATHTVQHTFMVKPSGATVDQPLALTAAAAAPETAGTGARRKRRGAAGAQAAVVATAERRYHGPDELIIHWGNVSRDAVAMFYLPEIAVDDILALSRLRQHPAVLEKVDEHTLRCRLSDITFIPLPARGGTIAGLLSLTLPPRVRTGQTFKFSVEQYSGSALRTVGAFQMTIPVKSDPEILPGEIRKLSVMRYVQQALPASSRWYGIFVRYVDQIAARVRGFGGDPDQVQPSPDGGEGGIPICPPPPKHHKKPGPSDFLNLAIPWDDCEVDGELNLTMRFRRKGD